MGEKLFIPTSCMVSGENFTVDNERKKKKTFKTNIL